MKQILVILGFVGVAFGGDAVVKDTEPLSYDDYDGGYGGNLPLPKGGATGGYSGNLINANAVGGYGNSYGPGLGYHDAPYPLIGPHGQLFPYAPHPPYGYASPHHFRRFTILYNDFEGWRPTAHKPVVPLLKKVVPKLPVLPQSAYKYPVEPAPPIFNQLPQYPPIHKHSGGVSVTYKPSIAVKEIVVPEHDPGFGDVGYHEKGEYAHGDNHDLVPPPGHKHLSQPYQPTPFIVQPSLSYGYSYKLVPTHAYSATILDDHLPYAHGQGYHGPIQGHH